MLEKLTDALDLAPFDEQPCEVEKRRFVARVLLECDLQVVQGSVEISGEGARERARVAIIDVVRMAIDARIQRLDEIMNSHEWVLGTLHHSARFL